MPKRIEGVTARLIECAKQEFIEKGFQKASIRTIAQKANTSPRAVYTRFPDKEGLFAAIVSPVVTEFKDIFRSGFEEYWQGTDKKSIFEINSADGFVYLIEYAYKHLDEFSLLLKCSEGTRFSDFIEELTVINCEYVINYAQKNNPGKDNTMEKLFHMLTHSFYQGMFEPIRHNMNQDEAKLYVKMLYDFFVLGVTGLK